MVLMTDPLINILSASLTLPGPNGENIKILQDINFTVNHRDVVSITGASGSGKTSLLMLIAGALRATSGKIIINNIDITNYNEDELAKFRQKYVGIIFQNFHLISNMTALENVEIALSIAGFKNSLELAKASLAEVGLEHRMQHYPGQLSGGEQQRVAIARAFAKEPVLLLADEATGNLDSKNGGHIMEVLLNLQRQKNTSLVLITHDANIAKLADKHFKMQDGRIHSEIS